MKYKNIFSGPFQKAARWLVRIFVNTESTRCKKMRRDLCFVSDEIGVSGVEEYISGKIAKVLMVLFWGMGICILAAAAGGEKEAKVSAIERPSYGEGTVETNLAVEIEGQEIQKIPVQIQERRYTDVEIEKLFDSVKNSVESFVLGDNKSLDEVRFSLNFPSSFVEGKVKAEWFTDPADLLDASGNIVGEPDEKGSLAEVIVNLSCQEREEAYSFYVCIFPPVRTEKEDLIHKIEDAVKKADMENAWKEELVLPTEVDGKKLFWKKGREPVISILGALVVLTALCAMVNEDERVLRAVKEKRLGLMMDYPSFLYKLMALLRAGLTMRAAFEKIAENAKRGQKEKGRKRYVYEEVMRCCNEIQSGIAETQAYENFGRRCQLPEYIKIGSILSQNLKKGSEGLADMLEGEALQGMEERQNLAKKLGEQAGTKLLFPMMLMLVVVMVILMVPAVMSFNV